MNQNAQRLVGSWRLLSAQVELADNGQRVDLLGPSPLGRGIFSDDGRMAVVLTAQGRLPSADADGAAALFGSMMAFSGMFRFEEEAKVVLSCDVAWHPAWAGTEQVRFCEFNGDKMIMKTGRQTHPKYPGREVYGIIEWQREA